MKRATMFLISLLLIPSIAFAGFNVCDLGDRLVKKGTSPISGCLYFNDDNMTEYNRVKVLHGSIRPDFLEIVGGVVVEKSQADKDAILAAEAQAAIDAENARITAIDDGLDTASSIRLTKVEQRIDNISNLADAKQFLKKLVRYLAR